MINGISHITLLCKNLDRSGWLFQQLFSASEVYSSQERTFSVAKEKYFLIGSLWIALMEGNPIERSYNHIAFAIDEKEFPFYESKIQSLNLERLPGRPRRQQEGKSIYFYDYDNHLFELHTGDLQTRLKEYAQNPVLLSRSAGEG